MSVEYPRSLLQDRKPDTAERCRLIHKIIRTTFPISSSLRFLSIDELPQNVSTTLREQLTDGQKIDTLLSENWARRDDVRDIDSNTVDGPSLVDQWHVAADDFRALRDIGGGTSSVVSCVQSRLNGHIYALKQLKKARIAREHSYTQVAIERFVHLLAATHTDDPPPPVVPLLGAFQSEDDLHLLTAYVAGGSLWDYMVDKGVSASHDRSLTDNSNGCGPLRVPERELKWWAPQMVAAIDWVHSTGFAHRDIKPQNLLLHLDGRLVLTDFGSAAPLQIDPHTGGLTLSVCPEFCGTLVGTPDYIAPEILTVMEVIISEYHERTGEDMVIDQYETGSDRNVCPYYATAVDWWSLGVTLFEMLFGQTPFWGPTIAETYDKITGRSVAKSLVCLESVSPDLRDCIKSLLSSSDVRLGKDGGQEVRQHAYFRDVEGFQFGKEETPTWFELDREQVLPQYNVSSRSSSARDPSHDSILGSMPSGFSWDTSFSTSRSSSRTVHSSPTPTLQRWIGWSWEAPLFSTDLSASRLGSVTPSSNKDNRNYVKSPAARRQSPRSPSRPNIDKEDLLRCVQASARKRREAQTRYDSTAVTQDAIRQSSLDTSFFGGTRISAVDSLESRHLRLERDLRNLRTKLDAARAATGDTLTPV